MRRFLIVTGLFFISFYCFSQQNIPSRIIGRLPNIESAQTYQIQVGAFGITQNANNVFLRLESEGFNPIYESYFDLTRVSIPNIPAGQVWEHLIRIKSLGFDEVIIREDEKSTLSVPEREGLTEDINNLIPDDIFEAIGELGIEIHGGRNPPNIEGTFIFSPTILARSNFSDFLHPGHQFSDARITFSKQDNVSLTVFSEYTQGAQGNIQDGSGSGSFITGSGNKFSVFVENSGTTLGYPFESVDIYSGEITSSGIINFHWAHMVTVESPASIRRGQGRLVYDSDGFSERVEK